MTKELNSTASDRDLRASTINKTLDQKAREQKRKSDLKKKREGISFRALASSLSPGKKNKSDKETKQRNTIESDSAFFSETNIDDIEDLGDSKISEEDIKEAKDWTYTESKEVTSDYKSSTPKKQQEEDLELPIPEKEVLDNCTGIIYSTIRGISPRLTELETIIEDPEETPKTSKETQKSSPHFPCQPNENGEELFLGYPKKLLDPQAYEDQTTPQPQSRPKLKVTRKSPIASPRTSSVDPAIFARLFKNSPSLVAPNRPRKSDKDVIKSNLIEEERNKKPIAPVLTQQNDLPANTKVPLKETQTLNQLFSNQPPPIPIKTKSTARIDNIKSREITTDSTKNSQRSSPTTTDSRTYNKEWVFNMNSLNVNKFYGHKSDHACAHIKDPNNVPSHYLTIEELLECIERSIPIVNNSAEDRLRDDERRGILLLQACRLNTEGVARALLTDSNWNWEKCKTGLINLYSETNSEVNDLHMLLKFRSEGRMIGECINIYFIRLKSMLKRLMLKFPNLNEKLELKIKLLALVPSNKYKHFSSLYDTKLEDEFVKELSMYLKQHNELEFQAKNKEITFPLVPNDTNKYTIERAGPGLLNTAKISKADDQEIFAVIEELKQNMKLNNQENINAIEKIKNQNINKQQYENPAQPIMYDAPRSLQQNQRSEAQQKQQIRDSLHGHNENFARPNTNFRQTYQYTQVQPRYTTQPRYNNQWDKNREARQRNIPDQPFRCYNCNKMGYHMARECRAPRYNQQRYNPRETYYQQNNTNFIDNQYPEGSQYISNIDQL